MESTSRPDNGSPKQDSPGQGGREALLQAIALLERILPDQAPISDFVHHNILHGFQHLDFPQALAEARRVTGASGYMPHEHYRDCFRRGRIDDADIESVLEADESLRSSEIIASIDGAVLSRKSLFRAGLLYDFKPITRNRLHWLIQEQQIFSRFQPDVDPRRRDELMASARGSGLATEAEVVGDLWNACLLKLGLQHFVIHPEDITGPSVGRAAAMSSNLDPAGRDDDSFRLPMHRMVHREGGRLLSRQLDRIGHELTLGQFLHSITGVNILDDLRPLVIRHVGLFLDGGMAAWPYIDRDRGFYAAWRGIARHDLTPLMDNLRDWREAIESLPEDPLDTVMLELRRIGVPPSARARYLERLALELRGWAGMFLWHANRPDNPHICMVDYLAVCLVLERLFVQRLCGRIWQLEASRQALRRYFRGHRHEFLVRHALFNTQLPEHLVTRAQGLVQRQHTGAGVHADWDDLAGMIETWQHSEAADRPSGYSVHRSAWRLFRLAQHLALPGRVIGGLGAGQLQAIFECLDLVEGERGSFLWLQAYERHYREQIFNALEQNRDRGCWRTRDSRPAAQITFCMDEREEGIRRHLEELDPAIETLGAAGFFGVAINWRGLDDTSDTPLCPIMLTPAHAVQESAKQQQQGQARQHARRRGLRLLFTDLLHLESRRNVFVTALIITLSAPFALLTLLGKTLCPGTFGSWLERSRARFDLPVDTFVQINATSDEPATIENPRHGFTGEEQADRVENLLRTTGLVSNFAPLVILMGHGSSSQNNPHMAAYDCGACSGRHSGPNARVFAAMANRAEVRERLQQRGLLIPRDTVFLGAEHNTCNEVIQWYDMDHLDSEQRSAWSEIRHSLDRACRRSAHERCRRFMSAATSMDDTAALAHAVARAFDFSQVRPELGHATNAAAFIGRRALSQGAFFDRRAFLISYDPSTDPEGSLIEAILMAAGPVGAGINLEYYFSTVNNDYYGCGTKVVHNHTGLFGLMEGAGSDLRTGLPLQMIDIHEAMRLLVIVEAKTGILGEIFGRQPVVRELVGNRWIQLAAIDPDSGEIALFVAGKGFMPWQGARRELPTVKRSAEYYRHQRGHLPPALIESCGDMEAAGA